MNIIFMGTPDFAVEALKRLYEKHNIIAVFTQPDKPKGRGYAMTPPPVKVLALEHGTEVFQPETLRKEQGAEYIEKIRQLAPDCIVVAAYGQILPKSLLEIPRLGCVNIHGSLLPKLRGAAPIQWSVLGCDKYTGITTMLMDAGLDTGDILEQEKLEIGQNETAAELFDRMAALGGELVLHTLDGLEKGIITPVTQESTGEEPTYAPKITKDMCPIDFSRKVFEVHRHILGLSDWPCAYTVYKGKRLKIYRSEIVSEKPSGKPAGTLLAKDSFDIACADGVIRFAEVQAEGGKRMNAQAYLRGNPLSGDEVFG
ncbi:methionyl-tRNA formyltransferase [Ruminococcaceae bacterium FB2012]|nr:methionyl-tRNA formyltransferase [Ruminococcaceae bacterium FB2012]